MVKTTVYLPEDLKVALGRKAVQTHMSEADLIRTAIAQMLGIDQRPQPRFGRFHGEPLTVEQMDQALAEGFGER